MFKGVLKTLVVSYGFLNPLTYTCMGLYKEINTKENTGGINDKMKY